MLRINKDWFGYADEQVSTSVGSLANDVLRCAGLSIDGNAIVCALYLLWIKQSSANIHTKLAIEQNMLLATELQKIKTMLLSKSRWRKDFKLNLSFSISV